VSTALKPELIETCFMNWARAIKQDGLRETIATDGKAAKGPLNAGRGEAPRIAGAWATADRLAFGQAKTEGKSNEITAMPTLLDTMALEGSIASIGATGCQCETADKIVRKTADYLFSLKGKQGNLHEGAREYFAGFDFGKPADETRDMPFRTASTHGEKHGRVEGRGYAASDGVRRLHERHPRWRTIRPIGFVDSRREGKGKATSERRHFVSSLPANAPECAAAVRAHWGIENSLHYVLDGAFAEDARRIRTGKGPETMAFIRKIALTIARCDTETKSSVAGRIKQMAWSES
jgi:predicted transposase YbfD/YdcC